MSVEVLGVTRRFGAVAALDDVTLTLSQGEFAAILGPSGSGKTTLLRVLAGLDFADEGALRIGGRDVARLPARERGVGVVFQHYALFRHMTVFENVAFGLRVRPRRLRPAAAEIERRVRELLELVQIPELAGRYPDQISGGQRQRVALARALAIEPRLLLLDEPFGALDARVRKEVRRWVRALHDRLGITSILVTHDQEEALEMADRVAVMQAGRIVQWDAPQALLDAPATPFVAGFLGDANRLAAEIRDGRLLLGPLGDVGAIALPDGSAQAFIRPGQLRLVAASGPAPRGVLLRLRPGADDARLGLAQCGEWLLEGAAEPGLEPGRACHAVVVAAQVFAGDGAVARYGRGGEGWV